MNLWTFLERNGVGILFFIVVVVCCIASETGGCHARAGCGEVSIAGRDGGAP